MQVAEAIQHRVPAHMSVAEDMEGRWLPQSPDLPLQNFRARHLGQELVEGVPLLEDQLGPWAEVGEREHLTAVLSLELVHRMHPSLVVLRKVLGQDRGGLALFVVEGEAGGARHSLWPLAHPVVAHARAGIQRGSQIRRQIRLIIPTRMVPRPQRQQDELTVVMSQAHGACVNTTSLADLVDSIQFLHGVRHWWAPLLLSLYPDIVIPKAEEHCLEGLFQGTHDLLKESLNMADISR
mmetsp:Transcript_66971/g.150545  ORF Transcript_66971/g.150545 Transcript_66971/m.150545 type:complete len:237 (+) Transcript_66971:534-1244(+)